MDLWTVRRLTTQDDLAEFNSGEPELDDWLVKYALSDQKANASVTYVLNRGDRVVGFYTLAPHAIEPEGQDVGRLGKGLPGDRSIAVFLLARLAIDKSEQGQRLGGDLLRDALLRCMAGAEEFGGRAVLVHAKNEDAVSFYKRYGFVALPENELHLYLLMKDIRQSIIEAAEE